MGISQGTPASSLSMIVAGPGQIRIEQVALPVPGPHQVRARLEGCGVCASNLPVWEGRSWFSYPLAPGAPGHEGWGRIDAVGEGVQDLKVGDRVAMLSYHAYAEHDIAAADAVVQLPVELAGQPFPGEPLGCAMNVFSRCVIEPGQTVAIVGIGFLGALLTGLATHAGARVIALSRRAYALDLARAFGAAETILLSDPWEAARQAKRLTQDEGCDCVIEAAGLQTTLDLATELTRIRGRLVIAGYHQDGPRQVNMQLWNWRGIDVINAHERDPQVYITGMRAAVAAVTDGRLDPSPLYTHRYPLDELSHAFTALASRPAGFLKALIVL